MNQRANGASAEWGEVEVGKTSPLHWSYSGGAFSLRIGICFRLYTKPPGRSQVLRWEKWSQWRWRDMCVCVCFLCLCETHAREMLFSSLVRRSAGTGRFLQEHSPGRRVVGVGGMKNSALCSAGRGSVAWVEKWFSDTWRWDAALPFNGRSNQVRLGLTSPRPPPPPGDTSFVICFLFGNLKFPMAGFMDSVFLHYVGRFHYSFRSVLTNIGLSWGN